MSLSFIFVFKLIRTEFTFVLFLHYVYSEIERWVNKQNSRRDYIEKRNKRILLSPRF